MLSYQLYLQKAISVEGSWLYKLQDIVPHCPTICAEISTLTTFPVAVLRIFDKGKVRKEGLFGLIVWEYRQSWQRSLRQLDHCIHMY